MPRYALIIEYDGTAYAGWQRQKDVRSVQQAIEEAAYRFCGQAVTLTCAGRTDAGVHARAQVAHLDLDGAYPAFRVAEALNAHLRDETVSILRAEHVHDGFHARFDARRRHYHYRIITRRAPLVLERWRAWQIYQPLDLAAMRIGAAYLLGNHDFSAFRDAQCQARSPIRTLERLDIHAEGDAITLEVTAPSFLHHQVRIITGSLVEIGKGRRSPEWMATLLAGRMRTRAGPTAAAHGLYLSHVTY